MAHRSRSFIPQELVQPLVVEITRPFDITTNVGVTLILHKRDIVPSASLITGNLFLLRASFRLTSSDEPERYAIVITFSPLADKAATSGVNRPGFPGECFICELRLPDHRFRWKHNKLFLLLPVGYGPAFPAIVDC